MTLGEIIVNDELMVNGTVSSSTGTAITAKMIRNNSLQARNGTFEGTVSNLTATGFTVATKNRKDQTITVNASTTFSKEGKTAAMTDLTNGSRVVVKGVWDRANSIVTAKSVRIVIPTKRIEGTVSSVTGNTLVITGSASTTFTVDVTGAKLVRRHGSTATLAEIKVGDKVEVHGKQATSTSVITALWVKNYSITASSTR
jgi:RNase P/RNase MRP subunit p29